MPAVADDDALSGERICLEGREKERDIGDVLDHRELLVDSLTEKNFFHHPLFADPQLEGLLGYLLFDQRRQTNPGQMTFERTLCLAPSLAIVRARPRMPCFAAT